MSETVRIRDEDYERIETAREVLGLPFPEVVHLAISTDILTGSPAQNARRAIRLYHAYVLEQYDDEAAVPVEDLTLDSADQAKAGLTVGAEKRDRRQGDS